MKLGAENPKKVIVTIGLLVVALVLFGFMVVSVGGSGAAPLRAAEGRQQTLRTVQASGGFDPALRADVLQASEGTVYAGTGRNIFVSRNDPPPPPTCVPRGGPTHGLRWCDPLIVPGRPQPADIPLKFFGFASKSGEPKKIFLSHDQDLFIAQEGDIVDRRYRIVRINPGSVEVQDLLDANAQPQTIGLKT